VGADRARVSHDPSRHWRGVISQQGRVTLEADANEADAIATRERRAELIEIVGPSGTPDDGYRVLAATSTDPKVAGDVTIQHGTIYVGGERMALDADLDYAAQPDWLDADGDPLWVAPGAQPGTGNEVVYLLLREQEVGAVEDPALLDVALGGPDTTARRRIVQRVVRTPTKASDCPAALSGLEQVWAAEGMQFDDATMRLDSTARLQVSFAQQPGVATPCSPVAQGGYLGAENQLIRVQISSVNADGVPTLVWGLDNASSLYRVDIASTDEAAGTTTLTLAGTPVDSYHQPAKDQAVEVLRAAAQITSQDYVAASSGIVTTLAGGYDPDTRQVVIATALTAPTTASPQLFLRVWQETITVAGPDPIALGNTGVQVTLSTTGGAYHVGDFWMFAVRPGTPTAVSPVYPQRILDAPQAPDGPSMWACELGVVAWAAGVPTITDCRSHFDDLVTLTAHSGGCCTIEVAPRDVGGGAGLQALIDKFAKQGPVTICLEPGTYTLPAPLKIGSGHAGLTIQACGDGVRLAPPKAPGQQFTLGLVLADGASRLTLRGLEVALPAVGMPLPEAAIRGVPKERQGLVQAYGKDLSVSIGLHLAGASGVTVERCAFSFAADAKHSLFAAAIFAAGTVDGLDVVDCTFEKPEVASVPFGDLEIGEQANPPYQVSFGYIQVPTAAPAATTGAAAPPAQPPVLEHATFASNLFDGLTVPVLVIGEVGTVRIEDNTVRSCYGGFWLIAGTDVAVITALLDRLGAGNAGVWKLLQAMGQTTLADPVLLLATVIGRVLPTKLPTARTPLRIGAIALATESSLASAARLLDRLNATALPLADGDAAQTPAPPQTTGTGATAGEATAGEATATEATAADATAKDATAADASTAPAPKTTTKPTRAKAKAAAAAATEAKTLQPIGTVLNLPPDVLGAFEQPGTVELAVEAPAADVGTGASPRIDVRSNQVDAVIADAYSSAGLLVLVASADLDGTSLVCTGNRIRSRVPAGPAVAIHQLRECTLTANIVSNELAPLGRVIFDNRAGPNLSLVLRPSVPTAPSQAPATALVAVTGNVLVGPVMLPARPVAAPLDVWDVLNTVATYVPAAPAAAGT
jgi:hypothetical protein